MSFKVIKANVLAANDDVAGKIREMLAKTGTYMINIISSPGAGKTSFLEKVGPMLRREKISFIIVTGDCFTSRDAERMDKLKLPVVQINTGNGCHIDAGLIKKSLKGTDLKKTDLVIVENVGNLICPAEFDVGEDAKIAFLSTAEGADKPLKYPLLFRESKLAVINKVDLLKYVDFNLLFCVKNINNINSGLKILKVSCKTGEGLGGFVKWIVSEIRNKKTRKKGVSR
ncbi:MAG: hydrogenase nickel incorporation protein HypB [Candidatus Omnitrophica bacterium]|nr:hydrogenase nickel incorporation protein HypB [Candidatus Omnitrophota bacterium]